MTSNHNLRFAKIPLNFGTAAIPALGFGTLIPALAETRSATTNALRVGFRHFDCAERYRNKWEVESHPYLPQTELLEFCHHRTNAGLIDLIPLGFSAYLNSRLKNPCLSVPIRGKK
jgi:diketogulonate reductase-like aldo/keto reductase